MKIFIYDIFKLKEKNMEFVQKAKKTILQEIDAVVIIYLFGSFASGLSNKNSDLDLAIYCKKKINSQKLWDLSQKIASLLNIEVDLVDLHEASTVLAYQIINEGKIIDCSDNKEKDFFENKIYSMYLRLNDTRKEILDNIKKRKGIY